METVTFKSVFEAVMRRRQLDPATASLTAAREEEVAEWINEAIDLAVCEAWWPDLMACELRYFRPDYAAGTTYAIDAEVYHNGKYYTSLQGANTGHEPDLTASVTWWEETESLDKYIGLDVSGATAIGTVKRICGNNPRVTNLVDEIGFGFSANGIQVDPDDDNYCVYLEFRKRPPVFTRAGYSASATYAAADLVYYATTGECYTSIAGSNTGNLPTDTTKWTKVDFPKLFKGHVVAMAYARSLIEDGQPEKAGAALLEGNETMDKLYRTIFRQQGQVVRARVIRS